MFRLAATESTLMSDTVGGSDHCYIMMTAMRERGTACVLSRSLLRKHDGLLAIPSTSRYYAVVLLGEPPRLVPEAAHVLRQPEEGKEKSLDRGVVLG